MNYQIENTIEAQIENPEFWMQLIQQPGDFNLVMNKEILRGMMIGFDRMINQKSKEFYYEQQKQKIIQMDQYYAQHMMSQQQSVSREEYERLVQSNRQLHASILQNKELIGQLNQSIQMKQELIQQHQIDLSQRRSQFDENVQYLEQQLVQSRQEKESVGGKLLKLVDEHNRFIATYDELYQSYAKYKQGYESQRKERDMLRQQAGFHQHK